MKRIAFALATALLVCSSLFAAQRPGSSLFANQKPGVAPDVFDFVNIPYPHDTFDQFLGVNNDLEIAGYHGATINKGFTYFLFDFFAVENYPGSVQTQVIGINNDDNVETCGFWIDKAGANHGFMHNSKAWNDVDYPGTTFNQLLGVNDNNVAAGYYMDGVGDFHPYIYSQPGNQFIPLFIPDTLSAQATGINDTDVIVGFYLDSEGVSHGFVLSPFFTALNYPGSTSTQALGINNYGAIVGSFTDTEGATHGFLYYEGVWTQIDDPQGVGETIVNGINDEFVIVGFINYSSTHNLAFIADVGGGD
jgi:probable HAF family extracellular repeat protein